MNHLPSETEVLQRLITWSKQQEAVRAVLLTSSRTTPNAPLDRFSDYDIVLVVRDIRAFFHDRTWLKDFGKVLVVYRDPIQPFYGLESFGYVVQYEDTTKIDFTFWPVELMQRVTGDPVLPEDLDLGYRILLDKDQLTDGLKSPAYRAYIPEPPTESAYQNVIEEFFQEATYVAKHLWRDDLMPAKYNLDQAMKQINLRQMLEWRMENDFNWSLKPGAYGKGLKKYLTPQIWAQLEGTYVGAGLEDNWLALFKTIALFRRVALEVSHLLGFEYLHELDQRMMIYLQSVKDLDRRSLISC
jgi:aminoglycoside 6-adenylyltransferase